MRLHMASGRTLQLVSILLCSLQSCVGGPPKLEGTYPGRAEFINGYGNVGAPMEFCPSKCTENSDFDTHVEGHPEYQKYWDIEGWKSPQYSKNTQQEIDAGFTQIPPPLVHSGEATYCKKPYPVCDYPNGDVYVRDAMQRLQAKTTNEQCHKSMKIFLCALYRRRCLARVDFTPGAATEGTPPDYCCPGIDGGNNAVWPVCWQQCRNAYRDCDFNAEHATLMCGEYIKAGWVQYDHIENCDSPAARATSPSFPLHVISAVLLVLLSGRGAGQW